MALSDLKLHRVIINRKINSTGGTVVTCCDWGPQLFVMRSAIYFRLLPFKSSHGVV